MSIGENIKALRKEKGLTQKELSKKSGIHEVQIRRYETKKDVIPKVETIRKIAKALDVPYIYLLDHEPQKDPFLNELLEIFSQLNITNKKKAIDYLKLLLKDNK